MTTQQLIYLLSVIGHKSLSKAADTLFLSQPALTQQITKLEHEIGVKLFDRVHGGMILTDAGAIVANSAQNILYFENKMRSAIAGLEHANQRELSVFVQRSYRHTISTLLDMLSTCKYPGLKVNLLSDYNFDVETALKDTNIDLAIYNSRHLPEAPLAYRILGVQEMMLAFSPSLPVAPTLLAGVPWYECLQEYTFVLHEVGTPARALEDELLEVCKFSPVHIFYAENEIIHHNALSDKRYVGFIPSTSSDMNLIQIRTHPPLYFYCMAAWDAKHPLAEELLYLVDLLSMKLV